MRWKKPLAFALKFALSAGLIWILLQKIDLAEAWQRALGIDPAMLALAFVLLFIQIALGAIRWVSVLHSIGEPLPFFRALKLYYICTFFSLVLPSSVGGDAVRMWMARRQGLTLGGAINGVMLERIVTVLALVVLVASTQPLLYSRIPDEGMHWIFPLLTAGGVAGILVLMVLDRLPPGFSHLRLVRGLARLASDTRKLFLKPFDAVRVLLLALVGHANLSFTVYVLALGLKIEVSAIDCLVLVPPVILATTLPISIAGWGVREQAMVTVFGLIGIAAQSSGVLSILLGLVTTAACLPGGLLWLAMADRASVTQAIEEEEAEIARELEQ
jgi:uncharacterized membrane protein YbhN (UPF0104 family)